MKGIVLAGGSGTRLYPLTVTQSKQLQALHNKPMIYYPLASLMQAGIQDILLITTADDISNFHKLLDDGSRFGTNLSYAIQTKPEGLAQAYTLANDYLHGEDSFMILGDNVFDGPHNIFKEAAEKNNGGTIFGYHVRSPERYGVVEFSNEGSVLSLEEKPTAPKSKWAIPGVYIFDGSAPERAAGLEKSKRGEYEIVDLMKSYMDEGVLSAVPLPKGTFVWLDAGTEEALTDAANYVRTVEKRTGKMIGCIEEVALEQKLLNPDEFSRSIEQIPANCNYRTYLNQVLEEL